MSPTPKSIDPAMFLLSSELEDVQRGLEFIEAVDVDLPDFVSNMIGEISIDNNGKLRLWRHKSDRDVWRLAPPLKTFKKILMIPKRKQNREQIENIGSIKHRTSPISACGYWRGKRPKVKSSTTLSRFDSL